jgi:hypothetical protein
MPQEFTTPTIVTLDKVNSVKILSQYVEVAQSKGAYKLNEAEILKRASDVLLNNLPDNEITEVTAKQLLIQGILKGQGHGCFTLNDAALLSKVVQYMSTSLQQQNSPAKLGTDTIPVTSQPEVREKDDDLSELADPIPLKPKEI